MQGHLYPFVHPALDYRAHNPRGNPEDLRFVLGDIVLEVLDEIDDDGLQFDDSTAA